MSDVVGKEELKAYVWRAYTHGQTLDLGDAVYGPATGGTRGYIDETMPYYQLLAGHVALSSAATVMEIGTHYGGSTLALLAGLRAGGAANGRIVTMDVTDLNRERLSREPEIVKVIGDSTEPGFVEALAADLPSREIDVLYIDALKDATFLLTTMNNMHLAGLRPKWLILDDVETAGLRPLWDLLESAEPERSILVSREFPEIRDRKQGFGFIGLEGDADLLARSAEFMTALGLDPAVLASASDTARFDLIESLPTSSYVTDVPDAPDRGAFRADLQAFYDLARDYYSGAGEIVDFGNPSGAVARALSEGLARNTAAASTVRRIHSFDTFRVDNKVSAGLFDRPIDPADSVLPEYLDALGPRSDAVNLYEMPLNVVEWFGKPVEVVIAGNLRDPRTTAHLFAQFAPHMMAGKSVLVHQEAFSRYRTWTASQLAFLADHFTLLSIRRDTATYGYVKPIPADKLDRLLDNRFLPEERLDLVRSHSEACADPDHAWAFLMQAAWIALECDETQAAVDLYDRLLDSDGGSDPISRSRIARLGSVLETRGLLDDRLAEASGKEAR